jgi:chloramphenicol 3-O phosphotransferase
MMSPGSGRTGRVLVINGTSSSGKTQLVRAIQEVSEGPWIGAGIDAFWNMIPARWLEPGPLAAQGLSFGVEEHRGATVVRTLCGPLIHRVARGMRRSAVALARAGCDVVCDDAFLDSSWPAGWACALDGIDAWLIGLHCPPDVLDARERARGDRRAGQARGQADVVHSGIRYDLMYDSSASPAEAMARDILEAIQQAAPRAFEELRRSR